jgi:ATPase subunit of ABC transporter with duplicated ATPase domains
MGACQCLISLLQASSLYSQEERVMLIGLWVWLTDADKALADVSRSKIRDQLLEVGFDDERQAEVVGGLSGGWKMKLELARAMLYNADLLLLDEVSETVIIISFPRF